MRDFNCRKISILSKTTRPSRLLFLDTETKVKRVKVTSDGFMIESGWDEYLHQEPYNIRDIHRFDLGWTCFERTNKDGIFNKPEWLLWYDSKKLMEYFDYVAIAKQDLWIFAHNIFFDLQSSDFFYWFTRWGWVLDFLYDKGTTYILSIHKDKRRIRCISTTNYFPITLERLGVFLGLSKLSIDFNKTTRFEKVNYCRRDTEIIKRSVEYYIQFLDRNDLGKFCMTRASQALTAYRYRFMDKPIYKHKQADIIEIEAKSYCGGRVECGFIGDLPDDDYVSLDVNSMYSFVMMEFPSPTKLIDFQENVFVPDMGWKIKDCCAIAEVLIHTDEPAYAINRGGKLIFPTGSFQATLCTGSLLRALKRDEIRAVNKLLIYEKDFIFNTYIDFFIRLKEQYDRENKPILRLIAKDFLNHLYGKFAQQKDITETVDDITFDGYWREETFDLVTGMTETVTKLFNKKVITFGREPSSCYFVPISSHVTDYARLYLYKLMKLIGLSDVLYVDTDSIKIKRKHLYKLSKYLDDHKLGALKIESEFKKFSIYGAKYYITDKEKKIKGVPLKAEYLGDYKYRYTQFAKQPTHLREQITRFYITSPVEKKVLPYYDKGEVDDAGKVTPFHLPLSRKHGEQLQSSF